MLAVTKGEKQADLSGVMMLSHDRVHSSVSCFVFPELVTSEWERSLGSEAKESLDA